jgi:hypothetical protein
VLRRQRRQALVGPRARVPEDMMVLIIGLKTNLEKRKCCNKYGTFIEV